MPILDEIGTYIVANVSGHTLGTNFFKGTLPVSPDLCTAIYEYDGSPPNTGFSTPGLKDETPGLQVITRGPAFDYTASRARIDAIYKKLPQIQGMILSGTKYRMVRPAQTPFVRERDASNRVVFACNFLCEKEMSA